MMNTFRRRLSRVEEFLPVPITAERFYARVDRIARLNGGNRESAMANVIHNLSDVELASVTAEFDQLAYGTDTATRDADKRDVLAAAGYGDLDLVPAWSSGLDKSSRHGGSTNGC